MALGGGAVPAARGPATTSLGTANPKTGASRGSLLAAAASAQSAIGVYAGSAAMILRW
jgi:hypothetical protein